MYIHKIRITKSNYGWVMNEYIYLNKKLGVLRAYIVYVHQPRALNIH